MRPSRARWAGAAAVVCAVLLLAALWQWTGLRAWADPERLAAIIEPHRHSVWALPAVVIVFVIAELLLFPVLVLIFVCGLAFGPWLGALYAVFGALASALVPFFIGRKLGRNRLERIGGKTMCRLTSVLERRGVMAVFLVRKIPAPYTLVNLACGAAPITATDFVMGTVLGMGTGILIITFLGGQLIEIFRHPEPGEIALAISLMFAPILVALIVQRVINKRLENRS